MYLVLWNFVFLKLSSLLEINLSVKFLLNDLEAVFNQFEILLELNDLEVDQVVSTLSSLVLISVLEANAFMEIWYKVKIKTSVVR